MYSLVRENNEKIEKAKSFNKNYLGNKESFHVLFSKRLTRHNKKRTQFNCMT